MNKEYKGEEAYSYLKRLILYKDKSPNCLMFGDNYEEVTGAGIAPARVTFYLGTFCNEFCIYRDPKKFAENENEVRVLDDGQVLVIKDKDKVCHLFMEEVWRRPMSIDV